MYHRGHSASTSLEIGEGVDEESNKKWHRNGGVQSKKLCPSHTFFYVLFPVIQSFLLGFTGSSVNITGSKERPHPKKSLRVYVK